MLELIEQPSGTIGSRISSLGAVASASGAADTLSSESDFADILDVPVLGSITQPSSETPSDILTFDDALLTDDDTDEITLEQPADTGGAKIGSAADAMDDDDFFQVVSEGPAPDIRDGRGAADDRSDDETTEPYVIDDAAAADVDDDLRLAEPDESAFEPAQSAASQAAVAEIAASPRRRSRRTQSHHYDWRNHRGRRVGVGHWLCDFDVRVFQGPSSSGTKAAAIHGSSGPAVAG